MASGLPQAHSLSLWAWLKVTTVTFLFTAVQPALSGWLEGMLVSNLTWGRDSVCSPSEVTGRDEFRSALLGEPRMGGRFRVIMKWENQ